MKYISLFILISLIFFNFNKSYSKDSLTTKQQLDRIMEELKDLNKAVFNKSFDNDNNFAIDDPNDTERFTSIDIRIYDLEKDLKNLTLQYEEILFKLDDLSSHVKSLEEEFTTEIKKNIIDLTTENSDNIKSENKNDKLVKQENTLGKIIISDKNNLSNDTDASKLTTETQISKEEEKLSNLTPEEQIQFALDQMMKKNYNESK